MKVYKSKHASWLDSSCVTEFCICDPPLQGRRRSPSSCQSGSCVVQLFPKQIRHFHKIFTKKSLLLPMSTTPHVGQESRSRLVISSFFELSHIYLLSISYFTAVLFFNSVCFEFFCCVSAQLSFRSR